jgi:hypothetical protein
MRWVLRLIATEGDARCLSTDLIDICRPEGLGDIADLGLTLPEAKQLLASVQRAVIAAQADSHRLQRPGSVRFCADGCCRDFSSVGPRLRRSPVGAARSPPSACAASAVSRQERVGASGFGNEGSCEVRRGIGSCVSLTQYSSVPASVDIDL